MRRDNRSMMSRIFNWSGCLLAALFLAQIGAQSIAAQGKSHARHRHSRATTEKPAPLAANTPAIETGKVIGQRIKFSDGTTLDTDDAWKQGEEFWYRTGGMTSRVDRPIQGIISIREEPKKQLAAVVTPADSPERAASPAPSLWILLKDGARMKVDEVRETETGAWYRRDTLSIFLERELIDRIERDSASVRTTGWIERDWTSGNRSIDELIRGNAKRFGLDPYLVFCVIEHESQFHTRAVSPKGARGLMQLMPGTASRFGVRRPFDPAENIFGGTQYLRELLKMFGGRVDLALASYNAGEGAVLKYGGKVPPYKETREYVNRITRRYGTDSKDSQEKRSTSPQ
jgi:hypothetical protein